MMGTREEIEQEIKSRLETYLREEGSIYDQDTKYCLFFNNFNLNLPCPPTRRIVLEERYLDDIRMARSGRTMRQFYADIDEAIEVCGINTKQMEVLSAQGKNDLRKRRELFDLMFPVFVELRARGYTQSDLVG